MECVTQVSMGRCSIGIRAGSQTCAGGLEDFTSVLVIVFRSMQIFQAGTRRRSQTCSECLKTMLRLITMYRDGPMRGLKILGKCSLEHLLFRQSSYATTFFLVPRKRATKKRESCWIRIFSHRSMHVFKKRPWTVCATPSGR